MAKEIRRVLLLYKAGKISYLECLSAILDTFDSYPDQLQRLTALRAKRISRFAE